MSKLPSYNRIDQLGRKTAKFATYSMLVVLLGAFFALFGGWALAMPLLAAGTLGLAGSAWYFKHLLSLEEAKLVEFAMEYRRGDLMLGLN